MAEAIGEYRKPAIVHELDLETRAGSVREGTFDPQARNNVAPGISLSVEPGCDRKTSTVTITVRVG